MPPASPLTLPLHSVHGHVGQPVSCRLETSSSPNDKLQNEELLRGRRSSKQQKKIYARLCEYNQKNEAAVSAKSVMGTMDMFTSNHTKKHFWNI